MRIYSRGGEDATAQPKHSGSRAEQIGETMRIITNLENLRDDMNHCRPIAPARMRAVLGAAETAGANLSPVREAARGALKFLGYDVGGDDIFTQYALRVREVDSYL